jgi:hypothetical protein
LAGFKKLPSQIESILDQNFAQRFQGALEMLFEIIVAMRRRLRLDSGDRESLPILLKLRKQIAGNLSHQPGHQGRFADSCRPEDEDQRSAGRFADGLQDLIMHGPQFGMSHCVLLEVGQ